MERYRVTCHSPEWQKKAYEYVRMDAFCFGQNIPLELEFADERPGEEPDTVLLMEGGLPLAGCRITYPAAGTAKIGRVCVIRERQRGGVGRTLIAEAERWIAENGGKHIVISSQDRAAGFYHKLGYTGEYQPGQEAEEKGKTRGNLGFSCVLVEKYLDGDYKEDGEII